MVGISAEGSEDWSNEFLIERVHSIVRTPRLKSVSKFTLNKATHFFAESLDSYEDFENDKLGKMPSFVISPSSLNTSKSSEALDVEFPHTNLKADELKSNSTKGNDENDSFGADDDWDAEFGITEEVEEAQQCSSQGFRHLICDTTGIEHGIHVEALMSPKANEIDHKTSIPVRCKIVSQLMQGHEEIKVVRYPIPTELFSLKFRNGSKQLSATELEEWLKTIISHRNLHLEKELKSRDISFLNKVLMKNEINCIATKVSFV